MGISIVPPSSNGEESQRAAVLDARIADLDAQVANLKVALSSARTIGIAVGIIMAERKVTTDEAFEILRMTSQHSHRNLKDVAEDVGLRGTLPRT